MMDGSRNDGPLRLRAKDGDDLLVFSTALQDAIVPIVDVAFLAAERRFMMVVNRFKWEAGEQPADLLGSDEADDDPATGNIYLRTNCAVRFDNVAAVQSRGVDLKNRGQLLDMLALRAEEGAIRLDFADGVALLLTVDGVEARLEDLGEPWPTTRMPSHLFEDQGASA
ncbi:DUF2948 family protein [Inquilinus sp. CAU 1745]|uniref:DUF2948 family protein n=1 Tax=Inquilinus sp. CAU 1745 TaxID=3140369 RepID=UPI00325AFAD8